MRSSLIYDKNRVGYIFILPSLCILVIFVIFPLIAAFFSGFFDFTIMLDKFSFVGLRNFNAVLTDWRFWNSMKNTLYFTAVVVPLQTAFSLFIATTISKVNRVNVFFRTIFFLPVVCSMTIIAMSIAMMFNFNFGIIPAVMRDLGLPVVDLLNDVRWAMPTIMLISVYKNFGFNMVIFIAALHNVPKSLYEAADIDGANASGKFFNITLPSIAPTITFTLMTSTISSFQVFDQVFVTTRGGPLYSTETAVQFIYERAFRTNEMSFANANAVLLFIVIFTATLIVQRIRRNTEVQF